MSLRDRWDATWADLGLAAPAAAVLDDLLARYAQPTRAYHTAQHLAECFAQFDSAGHLATHQGEVQLALWFHDAIYDTRSQQNEEQSAAWVCEVLRHVGASTQVQSRVRELVLATRHDARPQSADARLTVDVDLSILGAEPPRFDEYELQVRREYFWVSEQEFRRARAKILREFLGRPSIYATEFFRQLLEAPARANLARSLGRLGV